MTMSKSLLLLVLLSLTLIQTTLGVIRIPLTQKQPKEVLSRTQRDHEETQQSTSNVSSSSPYAGNLFLQNDMIDGRYYGLISLGKEEYDLKVNFDLHSLLNNLVCLDCDQQEKNIMRYSCQPSQCRVKTEQTTDKIGTVKGYYYLEQLLIGGLSVQTPIFLVTELATPNQFHQDGVISLSPANDHNIVIGLFKEGLISKKLFSFKFCEEYNKSELTLGGFDENISPEVIKYFPRVEKDEWAVYLGRVYLGKEQLIPLVNQKSAKLDTDESKILLPKEDFQTFFRLAVNHLGFCSGLSEMVCICEKNNVDSFPSLKFVLQDDQELAFRVEIPPSEFIYFDPYGQCFFIGIGMTDETKQDKDTWILGKPFLRRTYNVFDFDKKAVGLTKIGSLCD